MLWANDYYEYFCVNDLNRNEREGKKVRENDALHPASAWEGDRFWVCLRYGVSDMSKTERSCDTPLCT